MDNMYKHEYVKGSINSDFSVAPQLLNSAQPKYKYHEFTEMN